MDKRFWGVLGGLIVIAIILAIIFGGGNSSKSNAKPTENITGSSKTGVKLVEYGDFQCPACGDWYPTVHQVTQKYQNLIQFQFRNYPLTSLHPNALAAARAAQAAALQGKFWPYYNKLYQRNVVYYASQESTPTWIARSNPLPQFLIFAKGMGLNTKKFEKDYKSEKVNAKIQADRDAGQKLGVNATPTFYLDGKKLNGADLAENGQPSVDAFSKIINAAIKKKTGKPVNKDLLVKTTTNPAGTQQQTTGPLQTKDKK